MTKTEQIDKLTEARNALLAAVKVLKFGALGGVPPEDIQYDIDLETNAAIGLIAQVREARGLDD